MKILVTGGAGFIGSNIVEELIKRGYSVRVIDNFSTGRKENLKEYEKDIELLEGDIRNFNSVLNSVKGIDVILHEAALPSVPRSVFDPVTTNEVNVTGTLNVLQAARSEGINRVVFASSSSIYGDSPILPKREDMPPNPLSPYAVSKLAGEKYCQVFSKLYAMETIILRYFNVFGPKQDPDSQYSAVIPRFIKAIVNDNQPVIYGSGDQSRDFTYVANVVEANILAATSLIEGGMILNCACNEQVTLNDLVHNINKLAGKNIKPVYEESRPGEVKHSLASINKIKDKLGFTPHIMFAEGLSIVLDYFYAPENKDIAI